MTTHELAALLLGFPNIECGYFDGEGHWCVTTGARETMVDESNWRPMPHEKQTGEMRAVVEIE